MYWSFDEAHPALAEQHYLRTDGQNKSLEAQRLAAGKKIAEAKRQAARTAKSYQQLSTSHARESSHLRKVGC